ncbi:hypothetical protein D3C71_1850140 [compost metagenome]
MEKCRIDSDWEAIIPIRSYLQENCAIRIKFEIHIALVRIRSRLKKELDAAILIHGIIHVSICSYWILFVNLKLKLQILLTVI